MPRRAPHRHLAPPLSIEASAVSWRIGASTACSLDSPLDLVLDALAVAGISGLEIGTPPRFDPWRPRQVAAVRARLAATGIKAISMHAPFGDVLDLSDVNDHRRSAAIGAILTVASVLKEIGGSILVVHATDAPRGRDAASRLARSADALQRLHCACAALGLTLAIETPLPHVVGGWPDEFAWLVERVGSGARVCLDTAHATLGNHWDDFIRSVGSRVVHVHASDHFGCRDDHLAPGQGRIDWCHIGDGLRRIRFDGWLMLEMCWPGGPLPEYFARAAAALTNGIGSACVPATR
jgi:sugar phosphate isomerase/epimerase